MANKESLELANFLVLAVNAGADAMKDGKLDIFDLLKMGKAAGAAGPAFKDITKVLEEVPTWNSAERAQIVAKLKELDLPDDKQEAAIENAISTLLLIVEIVLPLLRLKAA